MRAAHHVRDSFAHNADHLAHDTPLSAFVAEVVCTVGATPPRTATSLLRTATSPPANGGNCTNRATTRRRHAEARLLMLQNPHHYPWCHAPSLASRSLTGAGQPGGAPINARKASPVMAGASRATSSATGLVSDEAKHPIGDHPTRSDRAQCSRSGGIFPHGSNAPKRVESSRLGVILPMVRILSEALRRGRPSAGILPRRCQRPSRDQHVVSNDPAGAPHGARSPCDAISDAEHQTAPQPDPPTTRGRDRFPGHGLVNERPISVG